MSNKTIHELDSLSEIAQNDEMLIYDNSAGADNPTKKTTVGTIKDFMANNIKDVYSTDEVKTNKVWIDGKPIYRRVYNVGTMPNSGAKNINAGITNFGTCVNIFGGATNGDNCITLPFIAPEVHNNSITLLYSKNRNQIELWSGTDRSEYSGYVTIEYTKTTD